MENKTFLVDIDKKWGEEYIRVRAKSKTEAKKKGWERFKRKVKQREDYNIYTEEL